MTGRPKKHSLTLRGHATSVTLEDEFWAAFCDIARRRGIGINTLAAEIDATRSAGETIDRGLASAIRVFVLKTLQAGDPAGKGYAQAADGGQAP